MREGPNQRGFTLVELMIVVAIIAILASIAIPNLLSARLRANESAAIATLKNLASAQTQCRSSGAIDINRNGVGEHGFGAELGAFVGIRTPAGPPSATEFVSPPLIRIDGGSQVTYGGGAIPAGSAVLKTGYYFGVFLPGPGGIFVPDGPAGGGDAAHRPDPLLAESLWCCYAWPNAHNISGNRVFFVNQSGDVLAARNTDPATRYEGVARAPSPHAAFLGSATAVTMSTTIAANTLGIDGQRWTIAN